MKYKSSNKLSSPKVVVGDLRLTSRCIINGLFPYFIKEKSAEDSRQKPSGMTTLINIHAFTLIELLVVVLIIGVLSAIAIPQYEKAVEKAKAIEAITLLKTLDEAQQAYFLANGEYAKQFNQLDVSLNWTGTQPMLSYYIFDTISNDKWSFQLEGVTSTTAMWISFYKGKYKGAGFFVRMGPSSDFELHQIYEHIVLDH